MALKRLDEFPALCRTAYMRACAANGSNTSESPHTTVTEAVTVHPDVVAAEATKFGFRVGQAHLIHFTIGT